MRSPGQSPALLFSYFPKPCCTQQWYSSDCTIPVCQKLDPSPGSYFSRSFHSLNNRRHGEIEESQNKVWWQHRAKKEENTACSWEQEHKTKNVSACEVLVEGHRIWPKFFRLAPPDAWATSTVYTKLLLRLWFAAWLQPRLQQNAHTLYFRLSTRNSELSLMLEWILHCNTFWIVKLYHEQYWCIVLKRDTVLSKPKLAGEQRSVQNTQRWILSSILDVREDVIETVRLLN